MAFSPGFRQSALGLGSGIVSGLLFAFLTGEFDPAQYLVEQLNRVPFEVLFVTVAALMTCKYGLCAGILYAVSGAAAAFLLLYPSISATSAVFLKTAATGLFIAKSREFETRFTWKFAFAALPGIVLAVLFGLQIIYTGVKPEIVEGIKQEAMDMYTVFMSPDDAVNAAENAISLMKGMFGVGLAILALASFIIAWLSFLLCRRLLKKMGLGSNTIPPFSEFALPFPVMWVFLASFGLTLAEVESVYPMALNFLVITAGLYGIQGLAVMMHFINRASMGRLPRVLFWLVFFITLAFSGIIFVFTGIIDNWIHIRSVLSAPRATGGNEGNDHEGNFTGRD